MNFIEFALEMQVWNYKVRILKSDFHRSFREKFEMYEKGPPQKTELLRPNFNANLDARLLGKRAVALPKHLI
jgi:hypothetical protein